LTPRVEHVSLDPETGYKDDFRSWSWHELSLERLLVVKRKLGRPKDLLMALQIEATLDEMRKKGQS